MRANLAPTRASCTRPCKTGGCSKEKLELGWYFWNLTITISTICCEEALGPSEKCGVEKGAHNRESPCASASQCKYNFGTLAVLEGDWTTSCQF